MTEKTDVSQLVIRRETDIGYRYFLARRTKDGYWEWIGGKKEEGESIEECAIREMKEELRIDWENIEYEIVRLGDTYLSEDDDRFRLNPVLIELENKDVERITEECLSHEHDSFSWIELTEYDRFETLGQYRALENLDLVNGDAALAVLRNSRNGSFLVVRRSDENTSPGYWGFVSGTVEDGESPDEAALRELEEETGLNAEALETGDFYLGEGETGYWRLFPVLLETGDEEVDLNWELSDHKWIELGELEDLDTLGRMKSVEKLGLRTVDREVAIAVPFDPAKGEFLAIRRASWREELPNIWEFPSGDIEKGESLEEAVLRELEEETGLEGVVKSVGDTHTRRIDGTLLRFYPFLVEVEKSSVELSEEHSDSAWVTREESGELETQDNFYRVMEDAREDY